MSEIPHSNIDEAKLGPVWGKVKDKLVVWEETVVEKRKDEYGGAGWGGGVCLNCLSVEGIVCMC